VIIHLDPETAWWARLAVNRYLTQLHNNGVAAPPELTRLFDLLAAPEHDAMTRKRALLAAASRRYRARKRAAAA
jgi:hypothetical protein